jgi:hypothetical protein
MNVEGTDHQRQNKCVTPDGSTETEKADSGAHTAWDSKVPPKLHLDKMGCVPTVKICTHTMKHVKYEQPHGRQFQAALG